MSETLLVTILSIGELTLITVGLAVYLFLRKRRMGKESSDVEPQTPEDTETTEPLAELKFADYLQQYREQTEEKLGELSPEHVKLMEARLGFLQTEINAQEQVDNPDEYWKQLIQGLNGLVSDITPENTIHETPKETEDQSTLSELGDIDDTFTDVPTLEDNISNASSGVKKDPSISIETANEDLERLRKIISRQHDTMDELKKSLRDKNVDLENNKELSGRLEEIEVAQAQLNMCVETLEKENERLNELINSYDDAPSQEEFNLAKQELEEANERINTLEKENSLQAERITELETEIEELEKTLEQRNEELARMQNLEADLSQTEETEHSQDSLMKEIETLTELITQKSEELSKLQSETTDDLEFDAELSEALAEDSPNDKAAQSG